MHKLLILVIHFLLSRFGALEYCLAKGTRRFRYTPVSHYTARLPYDHPAYADILITLQELPREPRCTSHMLFRSETRDFSQCVAWTIVLN